MSKLVFFKEDGKGNIYDENGDEAMDVVDEKPDPFAIKQLVNLDSYLEQKVNTLPDQEQSMWNIRLLQENFFFHYKIQHVMSVAAAARKAGVKESTACTWWKKLQENPDTFTLEKKYNRQNRSKSRLQEEHKQRLIEFFGDNANAYIQDVVKMLTNKSEGLEIKKSRVHEFMRDECNLSMKQTTCWPEARISKENVQKRYEWVVKWSNTNMDFSRNCIFIDEAGFDINMRASRAWTPRG
ncbi:hypothetical protein G6F47_010726 [Rhizopus delemar]|nr:hypothetical protein G6F47_010726 [Rhizopus delemar]